MKFSMAYQHSTGYYVSFIKMIDDFGNVVQVEVNTFLAAYIGI